MCTRSRPAPRFSLRPGRRQPAARRRGARRPPRTYGRGSTPPVTPPCPWSGKTTGDQRIQPAACRSRIEARQAPSSRSRPSPDSRLATTARELGTAIPSRWYRNRQPPSPSCLQGWLSLPPEPAFPGGKHLRPPVNARPSDTYLDPPFEPDLSDSNRAPAR